MKEPGEIGTELHERVEAFIQGEQIHDPEQDGLRGGFQAPEWMVKELEEAHAREKARKEAGLPREPVPCLSTMYGAGCGHDTAEHTGPNTPNQNCDCCTWRQNEPGYGRTVAKVKDDWSGRAEMREHVSEPKELTPDQMVEQMGCTIEELPAMIQAQMEYYMRASQQMLNAFVPPKMNRAQRRAQAKARRRR